MTIKTVGRVLIDVRQEDINSGWRCHPGFCPFALAINRVYGLQVASVGTCMAILSFPGKEFGYRMYLPKEAAKWICAFDAFEPVKPIKVWADLVALEETA